jgi:hypothetical protein
MQNESVTAELRHALASAPETLTPESTSRLRSRVEAFVDATKAAGWPIERVIVALKEIASDAGLRSSTSVLRLKINPDRRDALLLDIVRWCVERYFEYSRTEEKKRRTGSTEVD